LPSQAFAYEGSFANLARQILGLRGKNKLFQPIFYYIEHGKSNPETLLEGNFKK
jgi:hypothetical protein